MLAHLVAVEQLDPMAALDAAPSTTMFAIVLLPGTREAGEPEAEAGCVMAAAGYGRAARSGEIMGVLSHDSDSQAETPDASEAPDIRSPATPAASSASTHPGSAVAHDTYLGLYALQHRGQESAGIAVSDGETITVVKDMGLVTQVFNERQLAPLEGHLAIGHVRYSTTGSSTWRNAQPVYRSVADAGFALGHNGNLTNTEELAERARHAARRAHRPTAS